MVSRGFFMKGISKLCAALACALAGFSMGSSALAADSQAKATNDNSIKVFYYSLNDLYISQLSSYLQDLSLSQDIKLVQFDANDDLVRQLNQLKTSLGTSKAKNPVLVNPVDNQNGLAALKTAKQRGVPVIFFNRSPSLDSLKTYKDAWYIGTKSSNAGVFQAEIVQEYLKAHPEMDRNKDGVISYVMIKGESGHQDTDARTNAFIRTMIDKNIEIKPVETLYASWSQTRAQNLMTNLISEKGINSIELVVSNNDAMALGALLALQAEGYNREDKSRFIPIVGIDALPRALDEVERGTLIGTVYNDYASTADVMLRIARAYLDKQPIDEKLVGYPISDAHVINIPYVKVTGQNVSELR